MKRVILILIVGLIAGVLDLIPLFLVNAPMFNMVSIIAFWLCASLFIYKTKFLQNAILNGLLIALVLMLPMALAVSASNAKDFAPMMLMALILGPLVGFVLNKLLK